MRPVEAPLPRHHPEAVEAERRQHAEIAPDHDAEKFSAGAGEAHPTLAGGRRIEHRSPPRAPAADDFTRRARQAASARQAQRCARGRAAAAAMAHPRRPAETHPVVQTERTVLPEFDLAAARCGTPTSAAAAAPGRHRARCVSSATRASSVARLSSGRDCSARRSKRSANRASG